MRKTPVDYCLRLDDACPQMNTEKWARIERILDKYKVRPIVGVIPENRDPDFVAVADENFWKKACEWQKKGWTIALHGLHHELHFHEPSFYLSIGHPIAAVCIRTSTERPEALEAGDFILAGITTRELLNATDMAIEMKQKGVLGKPCPDYVDETVSMKVVRIIQGYVNVVNKMVWRKY